MAAFAMVGCEEDPYVDDDDLIDNVEDADPDEDPDEDPDANDALEYDSQYYENGVEFGEGFIVFEANAATYNTTYWTLREPGDADYQSQVTYDSGVEPVNDNYLEYTGTSVMSSSTDWATGMIANSAIKYTFTCRVSGTYSLAARIYQPTTEEDAYNDFWLSMEGNFTSGNTSSCATEALEEPQKFYGRGVSKWGVANTIEWEYGSNDGTYSPQYVLTEGEEYTITLSGRTKCACIDYLILYTSVSPIKTAVDTDIAAMNPAYYRPNGPTTLSKYVALIDYDQMYLSGVGDSKTLTYETYPSIALDHSIRWSSSDEDVVTIDQNGTMTGVGIGSATITATSTDGYAVYDMETEVGKYILTFDSFSGGTSYVNDNNIQWTFSSTAGSNSYLNSTKSLSLGQSTTMSATLPDGIASLKFEYARMYNISIYRTFEIYINGSKVYDEYFVDAATRYLDLKDLNVSGSCSIEIKNATSSSSSCYIAIDNVIWEPYSE